jgi:NADP-dependent 3-hydroxy acid dehydrogenase YdfG
MAMADTAVVTGASSGIGEAIAGALLDRGIPVVTTCESHSELRKYRFSASLPTTGY